LLLHGDVLLAIPNIRASVYIYQYRLSRIYEMIYAKAYYYDYAVKAYMPNGQADPSRKTIEIGRRRVATLMERM